MRGSSLQEVKCVWYVKGTDFEEECDLSDSECCRPMTLPGKTPSVTGQLHQQQAFNWSAF